MSFELTVVVQSSGCQDTPQCQEVEQKGAQQENARRRAAVGRRGGGRGGEVTQPEHCVAHNFNAGSPPREKKGESNENKEDERDSLNDKETKIVRNNDKDYVT